MIFEKRETYVPRPQNFYKIENAREFFLSSLTSFQGLFSKYAESFTETYISDAQFRQEHLCVMKYGGNMIFFLIRCFFPRGDDKISRNYHMKYIWWALKILTCSETKHGVCRFIFFFKWVIISAETVLWKKSCKLLLSITKFFWDNLQHWGWDRQKFNPLH